MSMVGRVYLESGQQVIVLAQWRSLNGAASENGKELVDAPRAKAIIGSPNLMSGYPARKSGPRNVLIRRIDGTLVVRPFRGLRKRPTKRLWYCTKCGAQTLTLPSGEVRCHRCGGLGLRGSECSPIKVTCPWGCGWSGWDDGGINDDLGRHLRSCDERGASDV